MKKLISALFTMILLAGCPAHTDVKATLKDFGVNELKCGSDAVKNEVPTVEDAVGSLLALNTPNSQALLDALFRQAPELIACTVKNIVNAFENPATTPEGKSSIKPMMVQHQSTVVANGQSALNRWGVK